MFLVRCLCVYVLCGYQVLHVKSVVVSKLVYICVYVYRGSCVFLTVLFYLKIFPVYVCVSMCTCINVGMCECVHVSKYWAACMCMSVYVCENALTICVCISCKKVFVDVSA